jgi:hypothetical protein
MSAEKIIISEGNNLPPLKTSIFKEEKISKRRVDINDLLSRVREKKRKENQTNLVFFGLFASTICVAGIILSF